MSFLKRILGRKKAPPLGHAPTAPLDPRALPSEAHLEGRRHVYVGAAHSAGMERDQDDDSFLVLSGGANGDQGLPDFGLFCVADGLGSYERGHIASAIAIRTLARVLTERAFLRLFEIEAAEGGEPLDKMVSEAFDEANQSVFALAEGGATTLTAALMLGDQLVIGHVGDTRVYSILGEKIKRLTSDHSLSQQMVEGGTISEEEAIESPHRSVLTNAMGRNDDLKVDVSSYAVLPGGSLLLCSDGLWGVVPEEEITRIVSEYHDPKTACEALVQAANDAGGPDNVTAVLIKFPKEYGSPL